jgi:TRAP-type C4-dicarboxylate transport system permease large subunit
MKIGVRLFVSSMLFSIAIAVVYGVTTRDLIGVVFLAMMAFAMIVCASYIVVAEREAHIAGDEADLRPADVVGEDLGVFTVESYWPILGAVGLVMLIFGVVYAPGFAWGILAIAICVIAFALRRLVREST